MPPRPPRRTLPALACFLALTGACARSGETPAPVSASGTTAPGARVTFRTPDGLTLDGRLVGSGRVAVALAHMYPADASSWYPTAERLAKLGYVALAFNFRGYDGSQGRKRVAKAAVDLRAAYDFLKARGATQVALVGASMGGTAAIIVASQVSTPAVVAVCAPVMFQGLDAVSVAGQVTAPVLLLAATADPAGAAESLRTLSEKLPNDEPKLFDGTAHGTNLLQDRPEASNEVVSFLTTHAPPHPVAPASSPPAGRYP